MRYSELSEDERKTLVLGLAHLAMELPEWSDWLRGVAMKLAGSDEFDEWRDYGHGCKDEALRQSALAASFADTCNGHQEGT